MLSLEERVHNAWMEWQTEASKSSSWSFEAEEAAKQKYYKLKEELDDLELQTNK